MENENEEENKYGYETNRKMAGTGKNSKGEIT